MTELRESYERLKGLCPGDPLRAALNKFMKQAFDKETTRCDICARKDSKSCLDCCEINLDREKDMFKI